MIFPTRIVERRWLESFQMDAITTVTCRIRPSCSIRTSLLQILTLLDLVALVMTKCCIVAWSILVAHVCRRTAIAFTNDMRVLIVRFTFTSEVSSHLDACATNLDLWSVRICDMLRCEGPALAQRAFSCP